MTSSEIAQYFNAGINEAEYLLSPARSSRLQLEQCLNLDKLLYQAADLRNKAASKAAEDDANMFLGFMCILGGLRSELLMWILLKKDLPNQAWDCLIAAQIAYLDATRSSEGFMHVSNRISALEAIEETLFPPQSFVSAGFLADRLDCSICHNRYSSCDHLRGKAYMGEFCEVIHRNPRGDHLAMVDTPADKRCRVTSFKTPEGYRDKLTWEIEPYDENETYNEGDHMECKSTLMALNRYPYLEFTHKTLTPQIIDAINLTPPDKSS